MLPHGRSVKPVSDQKKTPKAHRPAGQDGRGDLSSRVQHIIRMASETDPQGSYTGVPLLSDADVPVQDADDL